MSKAERDALLALARAVHRFRANRGHKCVEGYDTTRGALDAAYEALPAELRHRIEDHI